MTSNQICTTRTVHQGHLAEIWMKNQDYADKLCKPDTRIRFEHHLNLAVSDFFAKEKQAKKPLNGHKQEVPTTCPEAALEQTDPGIAERIELLEDAMEQVTDKIYGEGEGDKPTLAEALDNTDLPGELKQHLIQAYVLYFQEPPLKDDYEFKECTKVNPSHLRKPCMHSPSDEGNEQTVDYEPMKKILEDIFIQAIRNATMLE